MYKHSKVNIDSSCSSHLLIFDSMFKDGNDNLHGWSDIKINCINTDKCQVHEYLCILKVMISIAFKSSWENM